MNDPILGPPKKSSGDARHVVLIVTWLVFLGSVVDFYFHQNWGFTVMAFLKLVEVLVKHRGALEG